MSAKRKSTRRSTTTSAFGTPGRVGHDASKFYESKLYDGLRTDTTQRTDGEREQALPEEVANKIFLKSSEQMDELPSNSVHLMVTSPPYNVTKEYDENLTLEEYRALLRRVFAETFRVLVNGGRACINIANLGRKPYIPLHAHIIQDMTSLGFLMRGEIIWDKGSSASPSTAWGSWQSAANPTLRDVHEYILIFSKRSFARMKAGKQSTIRREDFLAWTKSVWQFPAERARRVGHPAPFPLELPRRLIELYTFGGDVVLDPFCGSGTTCLAARLAGRRYVGYDVNASYVRLAERRLNQLAADSLF
ncbi:MAG: SAM-dependent methyltransferase [Ignavibacteria bacterium]